LLITNPYGLSSGIAPAGTCIAAAIFGLFAAHYIIFAKKNKNVKWYKKNFSISRGKKQKIPKEALIKSSMGFNQCLLPAF